MIPLETRIEDYKIIKANTKSLLSLTPTERTSDCWVLNSKSPNFEKDKLYIETHFPTYTVVPMAHGIRNR